MQPITQITVDPEIVREAVVGHVVAPGEDAWDEARSAWTANADQQPALVAYPVDVADVAALVRVAREQGLRIAVQGSGHNAMPRSLSRHDDAILVRMDELRGVEVDAERRVARVKAGTLAGDVQAAAAVHGLAPLSGSSPDVSIAGYTLGGGLGWLGRKYGLCADSIVSVEVVLPDGRVVRADEQHEADLFWALRGGGGSFGVVTELELRLFDVPEVHAGWLAWPWEQAREVLEAWHAWAATAPDEVTTSYRIMQLPPIPELPEHLRGAKIVVIDGAVLGDTAFAEAVLWPLRAMLPAIDTFATVDPGALIRIHGDPETPMPGVSGAGMLRGVDAAARDAIVELAGSTSGSPLLFFELRQLGGALARREGRGGALGGFDAEYAMFMYGMPMSPELGEAIAARCEAISEALAAYDAGQYLNFAERPFDTAEAFDGARYARLCEIRGAVDPDGLMAPNHQIPAAS